MLATSDMTSTLGWEAFGAGDAAGVEDAEQIDDERPCRVLV